MEKVENPSVGYGNCIEYQGRFRGDRNDPTDRSSQKTWWHWMRVVTSKPAKTE